MEKKQYQVPEMSIVQWQIDSNILAGLSDPALEDADSWDAEWQ